MYNTLNDVQVTQFQRYKKLLMEWNERINLTSITDTDEIDAKHFTDSLTLAPYLENSGTLIDVGTGAGFPGIPLKIALPNLNVTLLDSLNKRISFLNAVINELSLENIKAIHIRAEDGSRKTEFREQFDYATARAVSKLAVLAEYCLPYVKVGGMFAAYKGADTAAEVKEARKAIYELGGEIEEIKMTEFRDIRHSLIMIRKIRPVSAKYPRSSAVMAKKHI
jgi:16S rRNA (guanine527-N7)-methyltransferase